MLTRIAAALRTRTSVRTHGRAQYLARAERVPSDYLGLTGLYTGFAVPFSLFLLSFLLSFSLSLLLLSLLLSSFYYIFSLFFAPLPSLLLCSLLLSAGSSSPLHAFPQSPFCCLLPLYTTYSRSSSIAPAPPPGLSPALPNTTLHPPTLLLCSSPCSFSIFLCPSDAASKSIRH